MWYSDRFYLGLSSPKILRTDFFDVDSLQLVSEPGQRAHYFLTGGYVFDLGMYTKFKPTFMVKAVEGAPMSFDLSANFLLYEKLWLGAMYRYTDAVGALVQYNLTDGLSVGYAYDYPISAIRNYSGGSHEFMLGPTSVTHRKRSAHPVISIQMQRSIPMRPRHFILAMALLLLAAPAVQAQSLKHRMAERYAAVFDYQNMAKVYEDIIAGKKAVPADYRQLAFAYKKLGENEKAANTYKRLMELGDGTGRHARLCQSVARTRQV